MQKLVSLISLSCHLRIKSQMVLVSSRGIYTEIIMEVVLIDFKKRIQNLSLAGELTGRGSINPLMSLVETF